MDVLDEMKALFEEAWKDFTDVNPRKFVKAFFSPFSNCDVIDNNMSEIFNGCILQVREKPLIDMFEDIRRTLIV